MAKVLMPLPSHDSDPTEVAVTWWVLRELGHEIVFATPDGRAAEADEIMVSGRGLDPWSFIPGLHRFSWVGNKMAANADGRRAYAALQVDSAFQKPIRWQDACADDYAGLVLAGGHRARGMRPYLESSVLQALVRVFFQNNQKVGAICHGVLLVARSRIADGGHSVLYGRKTTALTWALEGLAWRIARITRFWDPDYYRTYPDGPGKPAGYMSVEQEVKRALRSPDDFMDVSADDPERQYKIKGIQRDSWSDSRPAFIVQDANYLSARWPGDAFTFARRFAEMLDDTAHHVT